MRRFEERLLLSPGDLVAYLGCRHASTLDWQDLADGLENTAEDDPTLKLLQDKGIEHELAYLARLEAERHRVVRIPDKLPLRERIQQTIEAMRQGADVVYQAALLKGMWHGFADFLLRTNHPSDLGPWSYEVADTKLSSAVKPSYAVQLSIYADLVADVQGVAPARMSVVLGNGSVAVLCPGDFVHYVRLAKRRLEAFLGGDQVAADTVAEPSGRCDICRWRDRCAAEWVAADHLSLVANIRRSQRDKLVAAGIPTVAALAELPPDRNVPNLAAEMLAKLRDQARLQVAVRGTDEHRYELLAPLAGRGFSRLPPPAEGDLFFDMEGDPLVPGGLEYLFGVWVGDKDNGTFRAFWGHDRDGEKEAFRAFLHFVDGHLEQYPDAHIYHYNHYEVTAVRRLAMQHACCEGQVDELLRRHRFVDLFKGVREALLISEPAYSLKNIEHFYLPARQGEVATALGSIVAYEAWRVTGDDSALDEIERYNKIDCQSTAGLRDWLLSIRFPDSPWFDPAALAPTPEKQAKQQEAEERRVAIEAALLTGVADEARPFRQLVAHLVDFFVREAKPEWWAMFDREGREESDHVDDAECLGGLRLLGEPRQDKQSLVYTYRFPPQETKLKKGQKVVIAGTMEEIGAIHSLDMNDRRLAMKRAAWRGPLPEAMSLGPGRPIDDEILRDAVLRFADDVAGRDEKYRAVKALLRRESPRLRHRVGGLPLVAEGQDLVEAAIAAVGALDHSWLFIQGPPGTGKTWTASRVIVEMMRRGLRVGVASHSHKAINCLLAGVEQAAADVDFRFQGYKKWSEDNPEGKFDGTCIESVTDNGAVPADAQLKAGTAWLFARRQFEASVDILFIDEAGQVSLGGLVAMGTAARNIVLIGDQMQLGNPVKGVHPGESGCSSLEYLLEDAATVAPDRGIFLDASWRMHPGLCGWVSEAMYEGRLRAAPSTERQSLLLANAHPALAAHGMRFVSVEHDGRSQSSPEETEVIQAIWASLMGQRWRDRHGAERPIGPDDVLVVAPYNAQVNLLRAALPEGARVGTVDKFQGQEAPVVLVSMTSSSGEDMPRGANFLFSRNRLNVAVSRARCLAVIVASPRLLEVSCGKIEDMRLVDTLCHAYEWATAPGGEING